MKVLVTGSDGMLGNSLKGILKANVIFTGKKDLDVTKYSDFLKYLNFDPDYIIHLAAITDLEKCEEDPRIAYFINHSGTMNAVHFAEKISAKIVFIGTTNIFDGCSGSYSESDTYTKLNPLNHYGRSKLYGESAVLYKLPFASWVIRCGWMFGGGYKHEKKFIRKLYNVMKENDEVNVVDDKVGSLTFTEDVARFINIILNKKVDPGIFNLACQGTMSRYQIASVMAKELGMKKKINGVKSSFFSKDFGCARPNNETLNVDKINRPNLGNFRTKSWDIELKEYLRKEYLPYVD